MFKEVNRGGAVLKAPTVNQDDRAVTLASVRSGMISETAPTNVVLPTPNPPAMTIFVEAASRAPAVSGQP